MGMGSIWHLLIILIVAATFIIPLVRILRRTGHSGWWVIFYFIPFANIIGMWVFAYKKWPIDER